MRNVFLLQNAKCKIRGRKGHPFLLFTFYFLLFTIILSACNGRANPNSTPAPVAAIQGAATVTPIPTAPAAARPTYIVQRGTVQETLTFSGRWLPRDQMLLSFEIAGTVRQVNVRREDTVQAGDLLADFQITDLENQLASAELDLQTALIRYQSGTEGSGQPLVDAQFQLADSQLDLQSTEAGVPWTSVEGARINLESAQRDVENAQRAYDEALSRADQPASAVDAAYEALQRARSGLDSAQNSYYEAAQRYNDYIFSIQKAENRVLQNELALENAQSGGGADPELTQAVAGAQLRVDQLRAQIAQASLFAPIDGVVLEVTIQPGAQVQAFTAVITLAIPEPKEVIANVTFNDTQRLNIGRIGECQVLSQPETAVQCAIRQMPLSSRDADQTTRIGAQLDGNRLGQTIEVRMPLEVREDVLWVDPDAIRTFQNRVFVVLLTPDGERPVDVVLGLRTADQVEIISGVQEGDVIVGQ